jgi:hypothetical protein
MSDEKTKQNDIVLAVPTADDVAKHRARVKDVFDEFADKQLENVARSISAKIGDDGSRAQSVSWQPIETAPKDGTQILAFAHERRGYFGVAQWAEAQPAFKDVAGWFWDYAIRPTHWMPLPAPPAG